MERHQQPSRSDRDDKEIARAVSLINSNTLFLYPFQAGNNDESLRGCITRRHCQTAEQICLAVDIWCAEAGDGDDVFQCLLREGQASEQNKPEQAGGQPRQLFPHPAEHLTLEKEHDTQPNDELQRQEEGEG